MRGKVARSLRQLARSEMSGDSGYVPEEVVWSGSMLRHTPNSATAMYSQLKHAWKVKNTGQNPKAAKAHSCAGTGTKAKRIGAAYVPPGSLGPAMIIRPLRHIAKACPGTTRADGTFVPNEYYEAAMFHAKFGRGDIVTSMARAVI